MPKPKIIVNHRVTRKPWSSRPQTARVRVDGAHPPRGTSGDWDIIEILPPPADPLPIDYQRNAARRWDVRPQGGSHFRVDIPASEGPGRYLIRYSRGGGVYASGRLTIV